MNFESSHPSQVFWLLLILCSLGIFFSFRQAIYFKKVRPILFLRGLSIATLIFLLLDPKLDLVNTNSRELRWHVYIDRSLSMSYHLQPSVGSFISGIDEIIEKINKKPIPVKIYGFGTDLDTSWVYGDKKIQDGSTNIGQVIEHMKSNQNNGLAGSLLITDGQVNLGSEIPTQDLKGTKPIHVVGVGDNSPLVDVSIHSIDAPPVIIKGENAELDVTVSSHGALNQRLNVTLYSGKKLLGSKVVPVSGEGSMERVRFMINPNQTGEMQYRVQVNALPDEINIQNNKQIVPIQVLKNEYKIAIFTGAPNFNTQVIKNIITQNPEFRMDHFVLRSNGYSKPLKTFWDTKYDLILFDNHPVGMNAQEWQSYLRIFAKKLLSQQTSLALIPGHDIAKPAFKSYLSLMDLSVKEPLIELGSRFNWDFNKNWESFFPFQSLDIVDTEPADYPPLFIDLEVDSSNARVLANFSISEVEIPLLLLAEKSPLRYLVWSSPDLHQLYYKTQNSEFQDLTSQIFKPVFSWLMRTGNGQDFYFRSGKNSYQQGERVTITGKPVRGAEKAAEGFIHISSNGTRINSKPISYDINTGLYTGQFWASQPGELDYDIELLYGDKSLIVSQGSVQVQESQVELNHVYLNRDPLVRLAKMTQGSFRHWDDRLSILNQIDKQSKQETIHSRIVLHNSQWIFLLILLFLTVEWILRRRLGMM
ncbi:MAG: hypothetical protein CMF93_00530 [Candidatus Marinimicrobia bacterium]|nr:hypothetical protein [Candidatus Neomarinimicrobiota bacterium]